MRRCEALDAGYYHEQLKLFLGLAEPWGERFTERLQIELWAVDLDIFMH